MKNTNYVIIVAILFSFIFSGCNLGKDVSNNNSLQSQTSDMSEIGEHSVGEVEDIIRIDNKKNYPKLEIPEYLDGKCSECKFRELDISEFEVAIGPANNMLLCYDFTGKVLDEYTYQSLSGDGEYYTNEICEADVYLYNCTTDEKIFIMKSTIERSKEYPDNYYAYAKISLDDKSFWILDMV